MERVLTTTMRVNIHDEIMLGTRSEKVSLDTVVAALQNFRYQCDFFATTEHAVIQLDPVNGRLLLSGSRPATEEEVEESQRDMFEIDGELCESCGRRYDDEGY